MVFLLQFETNNKNSLQFNWITGKIITELKQNIYTHLITRKYKIITLHLGDFSVLLCSFQVKEAKQIPLNQIATPGWKEGKMMYVYTAVQFPRLEHICLGNKTT